MVIENKDERPAWGEWWSGRNQRLKWMKSKMMFKIWQLPYLSVHYIYKSAHVLFTPYRAGKKVDRRPAVAATRLSEKWAREGKRNIERVLMQGSLDYVQWIRTKCNYCNTIYVIFTTTQKFLILYLFKLIISSTNWSLILIFLMSCLCYIYGNAIKND